jgi:hypothetical protein
MVLRRETHEVEASPQMGRGSREAASDQVSCAGAIHPLYHAVTEVVRVGLAA